MKEKVKNWCFHLTSSGLPMHMPLGSVIGSLSIFPLLALFRLIDHIMPYISYWLLAIYCSISVVALYVSTSTQPKQQVMLVADKILGLGITFFTIPFSFKLMVIGFGFFHIIRMILPFISKKLSGLDVYGLGAFVSVIFLSLSSGLLSNGILRFILWVTA